MTRSGVVTILLIAGFACFAPAAAAQTSNECGGVSSDGTRLLGTLTFQEGKVNLDFGTDNEPQRLSATFEVDGCRLVSSAGLELSDTAAEGGKDVPVSAIPESDELRAKGEMLTVQIPLDPMKLKAGTYATRWDLSGPSIRTTSFKTVVTRSHPDRTRPLTAVVGGGLVGFLVALAGVWAAAKNSKWSGWRAVVALIFGIGLAAGAASKTYFTLYEGVQVWLPTAQNWWNLALASGAAAAGGTITGQLAKLFGSPAAIVSATPGLVPTADEVSDSAGAAVS